jgi:hypothetical protein
LSPTPPAAVEDNPKKQVKPEVAELIDGASLLSENEWVEIVRFKQEMDEEQMQRERDKRNQQKLIMKNTLEQQLLEKKNRQMLEKQEKANYEQQLAKNMKAKEEFEAKYKSEMVNRAKQQKDLREQ